MELEQQAVAEKRHQSRLAQAAWILEANQNKRKGHEARQIRIAEEQRILQDYAEPLKLFHWVGMVGSLGVGFVNQNLLGRMDWMKRSAVIWFFRLAQDVDDLTVRFLKMQSIWLHVCPAANLASRG